MPRDSLDGLYPFLLAISAVSERIAVGQRFSPDSLRLPGYPQLAPDAP
jgi:hypothetical protein